MSTPTSRNFGPLRTAQPMEAVPTSKPKTRPLKKSLVGEDGWFGMVKVKEDVPEGTPVLWFF
jgi:hypothetical protein